MVAAVRAALAVGAPRVRRQLVNRHRIWQAAIDAGLIALAWWAAFQLRFERLPVYYDGYLDAEIFLVVIASQLAVFVLFGLYNHWWRYVSIRDMWSVARAVVVASLVSAVIILLWDPFVVRLPRGIFLIDGLLLLGLVAGARLLARTVIERPGRGGLVARGREALIVGAGDAGQLIVREMLKNPALGYTPIGLVDDDERKRGIRLHGIRVQGTTADLPHLLGDSKPDEVIIAIPSAAGETRQRIVNVCRDAGVPVKTLPAVHELISGDLHLARQLREVQVEDVLGREAVELDLASIAGYVNGEIVLVTGAGGSIGSELCRQIAAVGPERLAARGERRERARRRSSASSQLERGFAGAVPLLADVKNREAMRRLFERDRPGVVFHAAAYKHVPLMEANPLESVRNNVAGTSVAGRDRRRDGRQAVRLRLDGQGRAAEERARADEGPWGVDRRGGRGARAERHALHLRPLRQRPRLVGQRDPALPPADRARRPGDRHASRDDALLHDDPGGGAADRPGRRDRRVGRDLRARHGRRRSGSSTSRAT